MAVSNIWHLWRSRFPENPSAEAKPGSTQAAVLRKWLIRALRRRHGENVEIKESFRENGEVVTFDLLAKRPSETRWEKLLSLERPRLKTARLAAYEAALKNAAPVRTWTSST